jgi:hypothetical protein
MANTAQSRKQKGRRLQQKIRDLIIQTFGLDPDDVRSTSMGAPGEDILMSPLAQSYMPFTIESKNQERLNIWDALKQAESNSSENRPPLVVFGRNRSDVYCALRFKDLLGLLKQLKSK